MTVRIPPAFSVVLAGLVASVGWLEDAGGADPQRNPGSWGVTLSGIILVACGVAGLLWLGVAEIPLWLALVFLALFLAGTRAFGAIGLRTHD